VIDLLRSAFAEPAAAGALPLVAALAWWLARRDRASQVRLAAVAGARAPFLAAEVGRRRRLLRRRLFGVAIALAVVSCMQPLWGARPREVEEPGIDLVVCLDVSRSMLARDLAPSRLERAHSAIAALARQTRGDRLGLVAFAGEARLVVPLTRDAESFAQIAAATDALSVALGGTDLGQGLDVALAALAAGQGLPADAQVTGAILLLTDGEDLHGRAREAALRCRDRGARVHCAALGSTLGSKIAVAGPDGREQFLRSRTGEEVVSAADAASLRAVAAATGGGFVDAGAHDDPLGKLYREHVVPHARTTLRLDHAAPQKENRYRVPLALALLLLLVEVAIADRRRHR
jgi:Ca-activated chloride channel family protein